MNDRRLTRIKLLHTIAWAFFAACILAIPALVVMDMRRAFYASIAVWFECAILALNHCRCPLTDIARRYSSDTADNFDIFLPNWLARYNKLIFGSLFTLSQLLLAWRWLAK